MARQTPKVLENHRRGGATLLFNLWFCGNDGTITAAAFDESVQITIEDHGAGMDPPTLAKIFDQGYTTKARRGNKGLGLAIVKQIVNTYGGASVSSRARAGARAVRSGFPN
jgi:signal transduction histidine kinase